ncbi:hypothetical protein SAMN02745962_02658 [Pseudomonas sp. LAIL14HWK12:I11]|nr:hypothetical protein SAMN02745962_02658 [Pseudomonas sp. LAIL14HWK12:I11]SMR74067.1 hypothetical protein SAMN05661028_01752 [Pseudomonas sp. LAIL14HWK12:I10]
MCCEEAGDSSEDLRCYPRPLRSTRLLLPKRAWPASVKIPSQGKGVPGIHPGGFPAVLGIFFMPETKDRDISHT